MDVEIVHAGADELGESPVWLAREGRLARVDISGRSIVLCDPRTGTERRLPTDEPVGFVVPVRGGGLLAGIGRTLVRIEEEGAVERRLAAVEPETPGNRFNDAACDARGRLWAGTMSTSRVPGAAALYRVEAGRGPERALAGVTISNGLDWNLDATRLYYVDSLTQRIDAIDFDLDRGRLGARRRFAAIDAADGLPDGLCVDAEGGVWVALFGGGAIRRYRADGTLDAQLALPVSRPTSLAFGGADLQDLYVTSARHTLTPTDRLQQPLAGSLLRLRPGVTGRAPHAFIP
jgi:sugar lactone lactonase YvrE